MTISRRLRFEVLRRDNHTCRYCGDRAPNATLTVDHVIPQTLGGTDDPSNLVAACKDCNAGKASVPADAATVADVAAWAMRWAQAMRLAAQRQQDDRAVAQAGLEAFHAAWATWSYERDGVTYMQPMPTDWDLSVARWMRNGLTVDDFEHIIDVTMRSPATSKNLFRYLAGVVRNILAERADIAHRILEETA